jgi:hypothetical protein
MASSAFKTETRTLAAAADGGFFKHLYGHHLGGEQTDALVGVLFAGQLQQFWTTTLQGAAHLVIEGLGRLQLLSLHRDGHGAETEGQLDDVHDGRGNGATLAERPPCHGARHFYSFTRLPPWGRRGAGPPRLQSET